MPSTYRILGIIVTPTHHYLLTFVGCFGMTELMTKGLVAIRSTHWPYSMMSDDLDGNAIPIIRYQAQ